MVKNLGLSLTDHYWVNPFGMDFTWNDANLFTNNFQDSVGGMQFDEQETERSTVILKHKATKLRQA